MSQNIENQRTTGLWRWPKDTGTLPQNKAPIRPIKMDPIDKIVKVGDNSDPDNLIRQQYKNAQKAQQVKLDASLVTNKADYYAQQNQANEKYGSLKSQAYTDNAMAERQRKESMANMGLSGAGGTSQTIQQSNTNNLLSTLGDVRRQQQDYSDNVGLALAKLGTQYNSDTNSVAFQTQSDMNKALQEQGNWQKQYDLSEKQAKFDQAWALYKAKRINKKQFEDMTGLNI